MLFHKHITVFGVLLAVTLAKEFWFIDESGFRNVLPIAFIVTHSECGEMVMFRLVFFHLLLSVGVSK